MNRPLPLGRLRHIRRQRRVDLRERDVIEDWFFSDEPVETVCSARAMAAADYAKSLGCPGPSGDELHAWIEKKREETRKEIEAGEYDE